MTKRSALPMSVANVTGRGPVAGQSPVIGPYRLIGGGVHATPPGWITRPSWLSGRWPGRSLKPSMSAPTSTCTSLLASTTRLSKPMPTGSAARTPCLRNCALGSLRMAGCRSEIDWAAIGQAALPPSSASASFNLRIVEKVGPMGFGFLSVAFQRLTVPGQTFAFLQRSRIVTPASRARASMSATSASCSITSTVVA